MEEKVENLKNYVKDESNPQKLDRTKTILSDEELDQVAGGAVLSGNQYYSIECELCSFSTLSDGEGRNDTNLAYHYHDQYCAETGTTCPGALIMYPVSIN